MVSGGVLLNDFVWCDLVLYGVVGCDVVLCGVEIFGVN